MAVFLQEAGLYGEGAEAAGGRGGVISGGTVWEIPVRFFCFVLQGQSWFMRK